MKCLRCFCWSHLVLSCLPRHWFSPIPSHLPHHWFSPVQSQVSFIIQHQVAFFRPAPSRLHRHWLCPAPSLLHQRWSHPASHSHLLCQSHPVPLPSLRFLPSAPRLLLWCCSDLLSACQSSAPPWSVDPLSLPQTPPRPSDPSSPPWLQIGVSSIRLCRAPSSLRLLLGLSSLWLCFRLLSRQLCLSPPPLWLCRALPSLQFHHCPQLQ